MAEIGLGAVQLGMPYGSQRAAPLMPSDQAFSILRTAHELGVTFIDTAAAYGESETRIGAFCAAVPGTQFEISSKISNVSREVWSDEDRYGDLVLAQVRASLRRLGLERFKLLQLHQCEVEFLEAKSVAAVMTRLREANLADTLGASVYEVEQASVALDLPWVSALQVPLNIIDQRFMQAGLRRRYAERRVKIIARSILLQGILAPPSRLPPVKQARALEELRLRAAGLLEGRSLHQSALDFVFRNCGNVVTVGLLGVNSPEELRINVRRVGETGDTLDEALVMKFGELGAAACAEGLLFPGRWD